MATVWVPFDYVSGKSLNITNEKLKDDEVIGILVSDTIDHSSLRSYAGFDGYIVPCFLPDSQPDLTPPREPTKIERKLKQKLAQQAARLAFHAIRMLIMLTNPLVAVIVVVIAIAAYIYYSSNGEPNTAENVNNQDAIETFDIMAVPVYLGVMAVPERFELIFAKSGCTNTGNYQAPDKKRIASIYAKINNFTSFKIQIFKEPINIQPNQNIIILANITPYEIDNNSGTRFYDAIDITHHHWQYDFMTNCPNGFSYQIMDGASIDFYARLRDDQTPPPNP